VSAIGGGACKASKLKASKRKAASKQPAQSLKQAVKQQALTQPLSHSLSHSLGHSLGHPAVNEPVSHSPRPGSHQDGCIVYLVYMQMRTSRRVLGVALGAAQRNTTQRRRNIAILDVALCCVDQKSETQHRHLTLICDVAFGATPNATRCCVRCCVLPPARCCAGGCIVLR